MYIVETVLTRNMLVLCKPIFISISSLKQSNKGLGKSTGCWERGLQNENKSHPVYSNSLPIASMLRLSALRRIPTDTDTDRVCVYKFWLQIVVCNYSY